MNLRRLLLPLGALLALGFLVGCETLSDMGDGVREKFAEHVKPVTRTFKAEPRATYEAARVAVEKIGFRFVRGGAAQGKLEAVSRLSTSDSLRSSRQVSLSVRLNAALDGGTEVSLLFKEIIESDSSGRAGQGTESPLRDTPLYEVYFRSVQQALDAPK